MVLSIEFGADRSVKPRQYSPLLAINSQPHQMVKRFVLFGLVAAGGLGVQIALLALLYRVLALNYGIALAISIFLAMTFNFLVHNALTFRDRRLQGANQWSGWLSFCAVSLIGGLFNMATASSLYLFGWNWALAGVFGAVAGGGVNFVLASKWTWGPRAG